MRVGTRSSCSLQRTAQPTGCSERAGLSRWRTSACGARRGTIQAGPSNSPMCRGPTTEGIGEEGFRRREGRSLAYPVQHEVRHPGSACRRRSACQCRTPSRTWHAQTCQALQGLTAACRTPALPWKLPGQQRHCRAQGRQGEVAYRVQRQAQVPSPGQRRRASGGQCVACRCATCGREAEPTQAGVPPVQDKRIRTDSQAPWRRAAPACRPCAEPARGIACATKRGGNLRPAWPCSRPGRRRGTRLGRFRRAGPGRGACSGCPAADALCHGLSLGPVQPCPCQDLSKWPGQAPPPGCSDSGQTAVRGLQMQAGRSTLSTLVGSAARSGRPQRLGRSHVPRCSIGSRAQRLDLATPSGCQPCRAEPGVHPPCSGDHASRRMLSPEQALAVPGLRPPPAPRWVAQSPSGRGVEDQATHSTSQQPSPFSGPA